LLAADATNALALLVARAGADLEGNARGVKAASMIVQWISLTAAVALVTFDHLVGAGEHSAAGRGVAEV
jgi:hypothetical protein